jgi:hypothetical protein
VPFVGCTIRTQIAYAFVAVARAAWHHTRHIQQNTTDRTLCFHAFLVGSEDDSVLSSWTALKSATGRGMDNTEGLVRGEPCRHDQGRGDRSCDACGVGQQMFTFLPAMRVPQGMIAVDHRPVQGLVATGTGFPGKGCSVLHRFKVFFCRGMNSMPMVSCGTPPCQIACAGSARKNGTHAWPAIRILPPRAPVKHDGKQE